MSEIHKSYSSRKSENTRVKVKQRKKTVGITLPTNLVKRARKHKLNLSRITEQALLSILDYLETQNSETSSEFLSTGSFLKESVVACMHACKPGQEIYSSPPLTPKKFCLN